MGQFALSGDVTIKTPPGTKILKAADFTLLIESQEIIEEAKLKAEEIIAEAEAYAQELREAAVLEGTEEGKRGCASYMLGVMEKSKDYLQENEERLVALVISVLRKILGEMDERETVVRMVRTAMAVVSRQSQVAILVSPDKVDAVKARLQEILQPYPNITTVDVVGDAKLLADQCVLETKVGRVETSLESQLLSITRAMTDAAPGRRDRLDQNLKALERELSLDIAGRQS